jgi:hypothetical protein
MHAALSLHARPPGVRRLSQARLGTRKLAMALELLAALERALAQRQGEGLGILAPFSLRPGKSPSQYSMYYLRFEDLAKTLAFGVFITKTKHKNRRVPCVYICTHNKFQVLAMCSLLKNP